MNYQPQFVQSRSISFTNRQKRPQVLGETYVLKKKVKSATRDKRHKRDSVSIIFPTSHGNDENYIVHNCLINRLDGLEDTLKILIDSYSDAPYTFNGEGYLLIHLACIHYPKNVKVMEIVMKANPSGVTQQTMPKLKSRPCHGNEKKYTTHSKTKKYSGTYPLHIALSNGASLDVVQLLTLQNPETLMKKDKNGNTPLNIAIKNNAKAEILYFLLAEKISLTTVLDNSSNAPLHIACMHGCCEDIVETILLSFPAALYLKNHDGRSPLDLARVSFKSSDGVIALLEEALHAGHEKLSNINVENENEY